MKNKEKNKLKSVEEFNVAGDLYTCSLLFTVVTYLKTVVFFVRRKSINIIETDRGMSTQVIYPYWGRFLYILTLCTLHWYVSLKKSNELEY